MMLAVIDTLDNAIRAWGDSLSWPAEQVFRLLVAAVAGGLVGLEREVRGRQAGFRTNLLVCVGSALVMMVSISFPTRAWPHGPGITLNIDPARIAYGIMTGIGFLGAGTILKHNASIRGLTTAAAMWCVAAIGMAAGFGMYTLAAIATLIVVTALWFLDRLSEVLLKTHYRILVIRRPWSGGVVGETVNRIKSFGLKVTEAGFNRTDDLREVDVRVRVAFFDKQAYYQLEKDLEIEPQYELIAAHEE